MTNIERKCVVTGETKKTSEMIRISKTKEGKYEIDSNKGGRGAYVTKNPKLADRIINGKVLHKAFKGQVPSEVYQELIKKIKE